MKKNRTDWDRFLYFLRHPLNYIRATAIKELRRRRIIRENIEFDYRLNKKEYDREFEREWENFEKDMWEPQKTPDYIYHSTGQRYY